MQDKHKQQIAGGWSVAADALEERLSSPQALAELDSTISTLKARHSAPAPLSLPGDAVGGDDVALTVEQIKVDVLPVLFQDPQRLGEYGAVEDNRDAINRFSDLMETGAVSALASRIGAVVSKLADADPERIARKSSWLEKITGRDVERHVRYELARRSLDEMLAESEGQAQRVRDTLTAIDALLADHEAEVATLQAYIKAGREYLDENPQAGEVTPGELQFDRPRERFARKLANLATLLASHEMSVTQMRLTRAQAVDMLDRFNETVRVLVPVWRQHTLALITTKNMSPSMVREASKAHNALMRSLSKSLEDIEQPGA